MDDDVERNFSPYIDKRVRIWRWSGRKIEGTIRRINGKLNIVDGNFHNECALPLSSHDRLCFELKEYKNHG